MESEAAMLRFEKTRIGNVTSEAASVFDVNHDGVLDIVSGEYWFEGPDFRKKHKIRPIQQVEDYYDDFCDYPMDVNGDGYLDIITGGWWGETLRWIENPHGQHCEWAVHDIDRPGSIETIRFWDVDGDGHVEIVPNTPGVPQAIYKLQRDEQGRGREAFDKFVINDFPSGHGLGFGDIDGDGRGEIILSTGWLKAPEETFQARWSWHPEFDLGCVSVPILVHDVNGDGLADLIVGQAHNYGLAWYEQRIDSKGERSWIKHDIDPYRSQYHDLQLADIDNDGELELITGQRYRAHCGRDPGELDPIGLYYFKINKGRFERFTVDYGDPEVSSGAGIYFWVTDLDGNGWKDIVAPGKEGLYLFRNLGKAI